MLRLAIAIGGAAGAFARHSAGTAAAVLAGSLFPWGTLTVNVVGSWMLGLLIQVLPATSVSPALRASLTIGFCAGFTTFSTFAYDAVMLARSGRPEAAAAYVGASLVLGVTAMMVGIETGALVLRRRRRRSAMPAADTAGPERSTVPARLPRDRR
jgi:fluoride exporter